MIFSGNNKTETAKRIINNLRFSALEAMGFNNDRNGVKALQAMPFLYTLFSNHLTLAADGSKSFINDSLVVGSNYGSGLLKTLVFASGLFAKNKESLEACLPDLSKINLPKSFYDFSNANDCEALSFAAGLSLSQCLIDKWHLKNYLPTKVYCVFGQEEITSGRFYEIAAFAGRQNLSNLICLVDFSGIDGSGFSQDHSLVKYREMLKALGWNYISVPDGSDLKQIDKAISKAKLQFKPTFIEINTVAAHGTSVAGSFLGWNSDLSQEEIMLAKQRFDYAYQQNVILDETFNSLQTPIATRFDERTNYVNQDIKFKLFFESIKSNDVVDKSEFKIDQDTSLLEKLLETSFDVCLLAGNKLGIKFDHKNIKNRKVISLGARYDIAAFVTSGIKAAGYLNPVLVADNKCVDNIACAVLNPTTSKFNFLSFIVGVDMIPSAVMNVLNDAKVKCWYSYNLDSLNKCWTNHNEQEWNLFMFSDFLIRNKIYETKLALDQKPQFNIFTVGLSLSSMLNLKNELSQRSINFNLIPLIRIEDLLEGKIEVTNSAPLVFIGLDEMHWLNHYQLSIDNKKILVKSNNKSITSICAELSQIA